jgi:exoribonuclease R
VNMNCILHVSNVQSAEPEINVRAVAVHDSEARTAVMEMMVLAGQVAAKWAAAKGIPVLYRYHDHTSMKITSFLCL